jgi:hypothetical protein
MGSEAPERADRGSTFAGAISVARAHPAVALAALVGGAAVLYVAVTSLWPSEERKVKETVSAVVKGLAKGDADAVMLHVSPYFSEEGLDREALGGALRRVLKRRPVAGLQILVRQVKVADGEAAASIHVESFQSNALGRSDWTVNFEEINGQWLIRRARPLHVGGHGVAGLRGVLALGG